MVSHEWIALVFFAHVAVAALVRRRMPGGRRLTAGLGAVASAAAVVAISGLGATAVREWAPIGYILAAYYLSGRTFFAPMPLVEGWLAAFDRRLLGDPATLSARWPHWIVRALDTAYIGCFLLVPAGLVVLLAAGQADRWGHYWTLVVGAELGAFAALPYLQTRPPWVLERLGEGGNAAGARASVAFMKHATTGANTLPSGHAAGSMAVAFAVIETLPLAGLVFLALALTISVAAVVVRAHFVVDILSGAALAGVVWWLARVASL
jgi:membrane-associated phospholipid phosphatase